LRRTSVPSTTNNTLSEQNRVLRAARRPNRADPTCGSVGAFDPELRQVHLQADQNRSIEDVGGTAVHEAYHAQYSVGQKARRTPGEGLYDFFERAKEARLIHEGRARVAAMLYHDEQLGRIAAGGEGDAAAHRDAMNGQTVTRRGEDNVAHSTYFQELAQEQERLRAANPTLSMEEIAARAREHAEIAAARTMIERLEEIGYY